MDNSTLKTAYDSLFSSLIRYGFNKEASDLLDLDPTAAVAEPPQAPQTAPGNAGRFQEDRAPQQKPAQKDPANTASPIVLLHSILQHTEDSPSFKFLPERVIKGLLKIKKMTQGSVRSASEKEALFGEGDPLKNLKNLLLKFDKTGPDSRKIPQEITQAVDKLNILVDNAISTRPKEKGILEKGMDVARGVADKGMGVAKGVAEMGKDVARGVAEKGQQIQKGLQDRKELSDENKTYKMMKKFEDNLVVTERQESAMNSLKDSLSKYRVYKDIFPKLPAQITKILDDIGLGLGNLATAKVAAMVNNTLLSYLRTREAYSSKELSRGKKEEKEHLDIYDTFAKVLKRKNVKAPLTKDEFAISVAKAHLKEDPKYYTKLKKTFKEGMDFTGIGNLITPEGKLDERELSRVIRLAIAAELDAVHLYELIVDSSDDETIKKVLQDIANEEKVHASELNELLSKFDDENEKFIEDGKKEVKNLISK